MNSGRRAVIELRGNDLYWTMIDRGEEHNGKSRGPSFEDCGREITQYLRFQDLGRNIKKQRAARQASQ